MATATTMRAVQVPRAGGPFQLVERTLPKPAFGEVRVRVQACGVCLSAGYDDAQECRLK